LQATQSLWSSLEISTLVVHRIRQRVCWKPRSTLRVEQGYSKLSPEPKAEINKQAAEQDVAGCTLKCYPIGWWVWLT